MNKIIEVLLSFFTSTLYSVFGLNGYKNINGKIYNRFFHGGNWKKEYHLVKEADPSTFITIKHKQNIDLGKDKNHIYIYSSILKNADPATFQQIKDYYWKDKNNVYLLRFGDQNYLIKHAHPSSFEVLENYLWAKDKNSVFYMFDKLEGVQPSKFQLIDKDWGKDNKYYYHRLQRLDSLDYNSAEIVNGCYMKDQSNVFYKNTLVKGANPTTFVADWGSHSGYDDKNMYDKENNQGAIIELFQKTKMEK